MLGVAAVHWCYSELAANGRTSSVSQKARGCRAEMRSKRELDGENLSARNGNFGRANSWCPNLATMP